MASLDGSTLPEELEELEEPEEPELVVEEEPIPPSGDAAMHRFAKHTRSEKHVPFWKHG